MNHPTNAPEIRRRIRILSSLAASMLMVANAGAQEGSIRPRGASAPPPLTTEEKEAKREQDRENMAAWLPRLVGRFKVEGVVDPDPIRSTLNPGAMIPMDPTSATGKVDCIAVGSGAGVQCLSFVTWEELWGDMTQTQTAGTSFLGPAATLYGMDPNAMTVRYLQLDTDGLVTDGAARLNGNTLSLLFEGYCPREPQATCKQETRIYAPPHGRYLHTTITISPLDQNSDGEGLSIDLEMTPIPQGEVDAPAKMPDAPARGATGAGSRSAHPSEIVRGRGVSDAEERRVM